MGSQPRRPSPCREAFRMVKPNGAPNLPRAAIAYAGGGPFWFLVAEGFGWIKLRLWGSNLVTPDPSLGPGWTLVAPAPQPPWYSTAIQVPVWVVAATIATAFFFAYWDLLYWSLRWWIPHAIDGALAPKTFRKEMLRLAKATQHAANSKGRDPTEDDSLAIGTK